ncbi:hypothetical protein J2X76_006349 [Neorhizobium sp. 2083]|uniref:DUF2934 domain-containing protein n=1 Tax=Neorhizobium sp. 2083 TaxID=2817762 RepID=UPI0028578E98|nr:DUF2934 domain-containing protein [Neorhizobium sp. 2083]MDR6821143.1 hypothetical protein [Neorhizobium sp. 2083]
MAFDRQDWITKRAYEIWEQAGRPDGYHEEHWVQATKECEAANGGESRPNLAWDDEDS